MLCNIAKKYANLGVLMKILKDVLFEKKDNVTGGKNVAAYIFNLIKSLKE
jgi:hypothetical protein